MKLKSTGIIYDGREGPDAKRSCAFTTVCRMANGTILVSGRWGSERDSPDGHECIFASGNAGASWELRYDGFGKGAWEDIAGEVKGLHMTEIEPNRLMATALWVDRSSPELPFINPQTQGLLPMRIFHAVSTDGGHSWGARQQMDTAPHTAASPCSMPALRLANDILAQPYEHWKAYDDVTPGRPAARLRFSHDYGESWPEYTTVAQHPENALAYWDQRIAVHPATGQLTAMFWTHDFRAGRDRDVHIAWGSPDGRSWSTPIGTGLPGQHCQPLSLGGDRLAAVYTQRTDPPGIAMSISRDFGRTWDRAHDMMIYDSKAGTEPGAGQARSQADLWNDMERWRFGHPRAVLLPDSNIFAVYYAGDDMVKSARWAIVAP